MAALCNLTLVGSTSQSCLIAWLNDVLTISDYPERNHCLFSAVLFDGNVKPDKFESFFGNFIIHVNDKGDLLHKPNLDSIVEYIEYINYGLILVRYIERCLKFGYLAHIQ